MDRDSRVTIDYLIGLPRDAVVRWTTHHFSRREPWTTLWIDIRICDEGAPPMNWTWTIIGADDPDGTGPEQLWQFVWPYDLDVHLVWDPQEGPVNEWPCPRGAPLPECIAAMYENLPENFDCRYMVRGGWSVEVTSQALSHWAATHAGRPDLRFVWDPDGERDPAVDRAAARARETAEGAPVWDLGDGVRVADGVMDDLLAMDPDERDEVMAIFKETSDAMTHREERKTKVLFVCDQNRLRSPTAKALFDRDAGLEVKAAGVRADALAPVTRELLEWADVIFVMEKSQRNVIRGRFEDLYQRKRIVCLYIPDNYDFMDPELVQLLTERVAPHLPRAETDRR